MKTILKKLFYIVFMLLLISILSFLAIHIAPNSFFSAGSLNPNMTPEAIERLKAVYGLDKPLYLQYIDWLRHIVMLNFGISFVNGGDVGHEILQRLPITLSINLSSMVLTLIFSLYLGIQAALNNNKWRDHFIRQFSLLSFSMPSFYLALLMILFFSVYLKLLPYAGLHSIEPKSGIAYYTDMLEHLVMPVFVMTFVGIGSMTVYVRSLTLEIVKSDYFFFAKARGVPKKALLTRYILPNLMPPIITLLGLSLPGLIGGSVILESIFGIDGMGRYFYMSAMSRDYPVIMGILMITALLTLLGNMIADLVLAKLNPFAR
jgi:peptide/nickel transport system permease protein